MSKIDIGLSALVFYLFSLKVYSKTNALVICNRVQKKHIIYDRRFLDMKKFLALILAGVMVVSMSMMVFAKQISEYTTSDEDLQELYDGGWLNYPSFWETGAKDLSADVLEAYIAKYGDPRGGSSSDSGSSSSSGGGEEVYDRGSEAEALAIQATGIPMATTLAAAEENKSVGEYMNNAVVAAPGLENAVPVSQGGNVIINGAPSNQTFSVLKVLSGHTDAAKAQAASIGGRVLNVARIDASVYFDTATVNFYMPGVTAGQNIQVYQYDYTNGQWTSVAVAEIREDH
ncbi:MAG: hypothetical protein K2H40_07270, partial [Lachnospiraceae bacterium]|nr:hypothetical protein [Lachnospiraceae bacterium]